MLIDEQCEVREDVLEQQAEARQQLGIQIEQMIQRYQQLTNPNENQDQLYIQQLLSNLVSTGDQQQLLKNLNQKPADQEQTILLLEQKLNEMGLDVEEIKQTQPRFFDMILLCYQANMAKLQQTTAEPPSEAQAQ